MGCATAGFPGDGVQERPQRLGRLVGIGQWDRGGCVGNFHHLVQGSGECRALEEISERRCSAARARWRLQEIGKPRGLLAEGTDARDGGLCLLEGALPLDLLRQPVFAEQPHISLRHGSGCPQFVRKQVEQGTNFDLHHVTLQRTTLAKQIALERWLTRTPVPAHIRYAAPQMLVRRR